MPKLLFPNSAPSQGLEETIKAELREADVKSIRHHAAAFGVLLVGALLLAVPAFMWLLRDFQSSGFASYFSLLFSDSSVLLSSLKEFGLSLIESLPVLALGFSLALLAAFSWALVSLASVVHRARGRKMHLIA